MDAEEVMIEVDLIIDCCSDKIARLLFDNAKVTSLFLGSTATGAQLLNFVLGYEHMFFDLNPDLRQLRQQMFVEDCRQALAKFHNPPMLRRYPSPGSVTEEGSLCFIPLSETDVIDLVASVSKCVSTKSELMLFILRCLDP